VRDTGERAVRAWCSITFCIRGKQKPENAFSGAFPGFSIKVAFLSGA
jgi:hypothetical protein